MRGRLIETLITLLLAGCTTSKPNILRPRATATAPATQPVTVADVLVGTYHGTVFDGEQHLPVVTTFRRTQAGTLAGSYTITEAEGKLTGELTDYVEVWPEMFWCRFTWTDKHGKGILSVMAFPDGGEFRGFWGEEIADPQLKWNGVRVGDSPSGGANPARPEGGPRRAFR